MKQLSLSTVLLLVLPWSLSACSARVDRVVGADGRTYVAVECGMLAGCMHEIYSECGPEYRLADTQVLPLLPGKAPMQVYYRANGYTADGMRLLAFCE